jgi:hypothetical protein
MFFMMTVGVFSKIRIAWLAAKNPTRVQNPRRVPRGPWFNGLQNFDIPGGGN